MFAEQRSTSGSSTKMQGVIYFYNYICANIIIYLNLHSGRCCFFFTQLLHHQILLRATGRDEASLDRMAFANLRLIHHLWVALVFIYAESHLLLLLVVSNLLLCQGVVSAPLCQNPSGKGQMLFKTCLTQQPRWLTITIGSPEKCSVNL